MILSNIIAPAAALQVGGPELAGIQHPLAPEVMAALRLRGQRPVDLWKLINTLADARQPDSRGRRRCWRLRFWGAIRELLRAGHLFRHGPLIAVSEFATMPRRRPPGSRPSRPADGTHRQSPYVETSTSQTGGSNGVMLGAEKAGNGNHAPQTEVVVANVGLVPCRPDTKSVTPTLAEISAAARVLARKPRRRKVWSGWLGGERMWRLRPVIVPGGQVLPAYVVRRGWVYAALPDVPEYEGRIFERYRDRDVQIYRSPHASLLGRQPPKPGSRPRGRPRRRPSPATDAGTPLGG